MSACRCVFRKIGSTKVGLILFLVASGFAMSAHDDPPLSDWVKFHGMTQEQKREAAAVMSQEKRKALIKDIRVRAIETGVPEQFDPGLLLLGDEEAFERLTRRFVHGDDRTSSDAAASLGDAADPRVVYRMGPALFHKEDPTMDASGYGRSDTAARKMLEIMARTPNFAAELRAWAAELRPVLGFPQVLILQEWWRANVRHFKTGRYEKVRPGAAPPAKDSFRIVRAADGSIKLEFAGPSPRWSAGHVAPHRSQ
jgi:hypothetical protein